MADKKISELTSRATLAGTDIFPVVDSGATYKATIAANAAYVRELLDSDTAQAVLEDANKLWLRDGTNNKYITALQLIMSAKDSDLPSYKNIVVKNTTASPNNQIDITYDNLQIGRIHDAGGSFLAFDVETAGNWDTGTAAEPTNGFAYVWIMAKIDGTVNPFYSLSATAPTMPSGYVFKRLISAPRNTSGNFISYYQRDNDIIFTNMLITNTGNTFGNIVDQDLTSYCPIEKLQYIKCASFYSDVAAAQGTAVSTSLHDENGLICGYSISSVALINAQAQSSIGFCLVPSKTAHIKVRTYTTYGGGGIQNGAMYVFGYTLEL